VARGVEGGEAQVLVPVVQGRHVRAADGIHAKEARLHIQGVDEEGVGLMEAGGALPELLELPRRAHVIEVGVGVEQSGHLEAQGLNPQGDAGPFAPGVHHHALALVRIPQQGAVAPQGADRKGFKLEHGHSEGDCTGPRVHPSLGTRNMCI